MDVEGIEDVDPARRVVDATMGVGLCLAASLMALVFLWVPVRETVATGRLPGSALFLGPLGLLGLYFAWKAATRSVELYRSVDDPVGALAGAVSEDGTDGRGPLPVPAGASIGTGSRAVLASLVVGNAIPLVGALLLSWNLMTILFVYWADVAVLLLLGLVRSVLVRWHEPVSQSVSEDAAFDIRREFGVSQRTYRYVQRSKILLGIPVYLLAWGIAWAVVAPVMAAPVYFAGYEVDPIPWVPIILGTVGLAVARLLSFYHDTLADGQYLDPDGSGMSSPVLHFGAVSMSVALGSMVAVFLRTALLTIVLVVCWKTIFDLAVRVYEDQPVVGSPKTPL